MRLGADHVRVRVPATSANLGPGFDSLGLALAHYDDLEVRALGSNTSTATVTGQGADQVPTDASHLVIRALHAALEYVGAPLVGVELRCHNRIPHGRGMGSSAAAVVAGIAAARELIAEPEALDAQTMLELATKFEGHPDNAAPAIYGGATVSWLDGAGKPHATHLNVHPELVPFVLVPDTTLPTASARGVLPAQVPHADAAFNVGRVALLVQSLANPSARLLVATEDRLHQEYRREVLAASMTVVDRLRELGIPASISGAGPSVLGWQLPGTEAGEQLRQISTELTEWSLLQPGIDTTGVRGARVSAS